MTLPAEFQAHAKELLDAVQFVAARGWCPATGGNFSNRVDTGQLLITASGRDKTRLRAEDLLLVDLDGSVLAGTGQPSAETGIHTALYALEPAIGAVLHTHSLASTVLSRLCTGDALHLQGYEMQKSISGICSHLDRLSLQVFDNSQDMQALAKQIHRQWALQPLHAGLLLRGHGLYAWGRDMAEARRHLEGLEFLLGCELAYRQAGAPA